MIKKRTVLVLGAGASYDLGFPLGERLWQDIYSFILNQSRGYVNNQSSIREDNSKLLARLLELAVEFEDVKTETDERFVKRFAEELFDAQPKSIDQFLSDRPEYSLIGRICIVFCISRYEDKRSKNFFPFKDGDDYVFPDFGWYKYLWDKMTENINTIEEFKEKNKITVITFNYDRSLEFYLFRALKSKFDKHDAEIADVFREIEIKHVYGRLAPFYWEQNYLNQNSELSDKDLAMECTDFMPWEPSVLFRIWGEVGTHGMDKNDFESNESDIPAVTYEPKGSKRSVYKEKDRREIVKRFIKAANDIKIYSEVLEGRKTQEYLGDLEGAKRIYFLGFGYHEQNLSALGLKNEMLEQDPDIYGTAYGMSDGEKDAIIRRIHKSIYIDKSNKIPKGIVTVENNWVSMDREGSVIKDFFRKVTNADLV